MLFRSDPDTTTADREREREDEGVEEDRMESRQRRRGGDRRGTERLTRDGERWVEGENTGDKSG